MKVDEKQISQELEDEGARKFFESYDKLLRAVEEKKRTMKIALQSRRGVKLMDQITTTRQDNLSKNQGKVLTDQHVALYRDGEGQLHAVSSICTHLACDVEWNDQDKVWDCPAMVPGSPRLERS